MSGAVPDQMPDSVTREKPTTMQWIACLLGQHDWCARVDLGGKPVKALIEADPIGYFAKWCAPVCRHCPKQLTPRVVTYYE